ncbi:hypothetical protein HJG60_011548 [Phyllostomus discolor]|uniref:Uncharacterized protein n=1 Tax=Phyllostomus discolor TaxID=89673 RepID=A0A834E383_9CHIR|nr:hypothetical protein HJG60_011548 [Phyllostomus discolor]
MVSRPPQPLAAKEGSYPPPKLLILFLPSDPLNLSRILRTFAQGAPLFSPISLFVFYPPRLLSAAYPYLTHPLFPLGSALGSPSLLPSLSALSDRCWQLLFAWVSGPSSVPMSRIYFDFLCLVLLGNGEHPCCFFSRLLLFQSQVFPQGLPGLHSSLCTVAFSLLL